MASAGTAIFDSALPFSPSSIDNKSTALLLLDYHEFIIQQLGEDGARAVKAAAQIREWAHQNEVPVIHCFINTESFAYVQPQMKLASRIPQLKGMMEKMPGMLGGSSVLAPKPDQQASEPIFERVLGTVSALSSPGILDKLREKNTRSLILCGLSTSGCVLSTTRAASDLGFVVTVVSDACADPTPGMHDMLIKGALPMTAHVASAAEIEEDRKTRA